MRHPSTCATWLESVLDTKGFIREAWCSVTVRQANPHNYDAWFDYLRLSEDGGDVEATREVYERAISNIPLIAEKRHWRRYIYLWINYALFEELETKVSFNMIFLLRTWHHKWSLMRALYNETLFYFFDFVYFFLKTDVSRP